MTSINFFFFQFSAIFLVFLFFIALLDNYWTMFYNILHSLMQQFVINICYVCTTVCKQSIVSMPVYRVLALHHFPSIPEKQLLHEEKLFGLLLFRVSRGNLSRTKNILTLHFRYTCTRLPCTHTVPFPFLPFRIIKGMFCFRV